MEKIFELLGQARPENQLLWQMINLAGIILLSGLVYLITRKVIMRMIIKLIKKSKTTIDDLLLDKKLLSRLSLIPPVIVIYILAYLIPDAEEIIHRISLAIIGLIILLMAGSVFSILDHFYERSSLVRDKPIKSYIQIIKLIVYIFGTIIIIATLIGQSPWYLLTGLGAMTAVLILVFRDTILSFVASLQISSNDLVRVGDWIEVPTFGADGDVIDIALHTVKVQNWDKTITTIPTHKLIEVSFKNWRGMQMTGGRRIKRAVYIDQSSVRFCDKPLLEHLEKISLLKDYLSRMQQEVTAYNQKYGYDDTNLVNGRRLTNIGTLRAYIDLYLKQHERIHKDLTIMVRQLAPGPNGLPLEIYAFTNDTAWATYEGIQADIFDHILAVVPQFGLTIFQNPSGRDFQRMVSGNGN